jgi:hypothetical protein
LVVIEIMLSGYLIGPRENSFKNYFLFSNKPRAANGQD